jgi:hypothetical protein
MNPLSSVAFEGGILDTRRRNLRHENQIVAWSIAIDAIRLGDPEKIASDLAAAGAS